MAPLSVLSALEDCHAIQPVIKDWKFEGKIKFGETKNAIYTN